MWTFLIVIALVATAAAFALRKKPSPAPPKSDLLAQVAAMERKASELEAMLAALPDDDDSEQEEVARSGGDYGPWDRTVDFFSREIAIPLSIEYVGGSGKASERLITVNGYKYGQTGGVISAYCHERGGARTFYFTRIKRAIDPEAGAEITDLGKWLDAQFLLTMPGQAEALMQQQFSALHALFYVAKADGAFRAKEKASIGEFLSAAVPDTPDAVIQMVLVVVAQWAVPSAIAYGKALAELQKMPEAYRRLVMSVANDLVASDKASVHAENNAIKRMTQALSESALAVT